MSNRILKIQIDKDYYGVIKRKYLDDNNHMDNTIYLRTSKKIVLPPRLYNLLKVGDSVYKKSSSKFIYVKRSNKVIELSYEKSDFE